MKCPICNQRTPDDQPHCQKCGILLPACPTCGKPLLVQTRFCPEDGTPIPFRVNTLLPPDPNNGSEDMAWQFAVDANPKSESAAPGQPSRPMPQISSGRQSSSAAGSEARESKAPAEQVFTPIPNKRKATPTPQPFAPDNTQYRAPRNNKPALIGLFVFLILVIVALVVLLVVPIGQEEKNLEQTPTNSYAPVPNYPAFTESPDAVVSMEMPNCVGSHRDDVQASFSGMEVTITYEYEYSDTVEQGYVIRQNYNPEFPLEPGNQIVLVISKGADVAPEGYNQKVVVTASPGSSYGELELLEWQDGQWVSLFYCSATVGHNGISSSYSEGSKRTPMGTFKLGVALSPNSLPNPDWPYRRVTSDTCVVDDLNSPYYNTVQSISTLPYGTHYDPIGNTLTKGYSNILIYIEHNGNGLDSNNVVPGKCSVITICGRPGGIAPTAGCVDISGSDMMTLITLLDYDKNPHIEITTR